MCKPMIAATVAVLLVLDNAPPAPRARRRRSAGTACGDRRADARRRPRREVEEWIAASPGSAVLRVNGSKRS